MKVVWAVMPELELDCNLQSISASIEGSLPENTASWQARCNERHCRCLTSKTRGNRQQMRDVRIAHR